MAWAVLSHWYDGKKDIVKLFSIHCFDSWWQDTNVSLGTLNVLSSNFSLASWTLLPFQYKLFIRVRLQAVLLNPI